MINSDDPIAGEPARPLPRRMLADAAAHLRNARPPPTACVALGRAYDSSYVLRYRDRAPVPLVLTVLVASPPALGPAWTTPNRTS